MGVIYIRVGQPIPEFKPTDLVVYMPQLVIDGHDVSQQKALPSPESDATSPPADAPAIAGRRET